MIKSAAIDGCLPPARYWAYVFMYTLLLSLSLSLSRPPHKGSIISAIYHWDNWKSEMLSYGKENGADLGFEPSFTWL